MVGEVIIYILWHRFQIELKHDDVGFSFYTLENDKIRTRN